MKKAIDIYVQSIARDNAAVICEGGYTSIADYIITTADSASSYNEFFDDSELLAPSCEPTEEQIEELKDYLNEYYNYMP